MAVADYLALIPAANADKPSFTATVEASVTPFAQSGALNPVNIDLATISGSMLDYVGQWIGFSRTLSVPVTGIYFSLDTVNLGFDQGNWYSIYDPSTGLVSLDDTTYRQFLGAKLLSNNTDGSAAALQNIVNTIFAPSGGAFVIDNQDMTISTIITGTTSVLAQQIVAKDLCPLRPMGVEMSVYSSSAAVFAFDIAPNTYLAGFDVGMWAVPL
jgi:hypothetical protein